MALLSINLGVLNLLPVPVLDGGHLLFYIMELIFRRPVPQKIREYAQQIGMVLLLGLMVLAFYNDIVRYFITRQG
jgi:regulator of sigma E protease